MAGRWITLKVESADMRCYVAEPTGAGPHPGVAVAMHGIGVDAWMERTCERFAGAGYAAACSDLFHREGPNPPKEWGPKIKNLRDANIIKDMNAAIAWLQANKAVRRDRIGVTGYCMGGRVSYLMAATNPALKAAAVYYGGGIKNPWGDPPTPFDRTKDIACPVLGLFGEQDTNPSPADVKDFDAALTRLGKRHEFHIYQGVGHAFMMEERPGFKQDVSDDAWQKTMTWFGKYLKA
ncbi:MAG: dienelactone hydrolase family protein [Chloroflexi bacterium]|nr:dienelactone hydrolase family protein [Chloroflexota bacterium]